MHTPSYRTWIEISKPAIANNYRIFRKLISPKTKLLGIVKSNAYGHELMGFAQALCGLGADFLGVDSITEANTLRKKNIKIPILVLGHTLPGNYNLARRHNLSLTLSSLESLKALGREKGKVSIHLKVDTGMHRQGFSPADLPSV
jgi:alanine racemase